MKIHCPNKERCGSCSWSHIPYKNQLEQKLSDINGSFKIKGLDLEIKNIIPSPITEHYRNRMDFVIDFEGRVGLREKGKWWKVIDDHTCFLGSERIEEIFHITRKWTQEAGLSFFDRKAHTGFLRYAVIRTTTLGDSMLIIVTSAPKDEEEKKLAESAFEKLIEKTGVDTFVWSINNTITDVSFGDELITLQGTGYITEKINNLEYRITPNAFFQTNPAGAKLLQDTVLEFAGDTSNKTILDLYCGSGFFSIAFAKASQNVIGVELNKEAIRDARINAKINNVNVTFHDEKTENFDWKSIKPDILILDPPRSGMHDKALQDVITLQPKKIIYISCSYKNFAREMIMLQEKYILKNIIAIDMFPHTPHVEIVSELILKV